MSVARRVAKKIHLELKTMKCFFDTLFGEILTPRNSDRCIFLLDILEINGYLAGLFYEHCLASDLRES